MPLNNFWYYFMQFPLSNGINMSFKRINDFSGVRNRYPYNLFVICGNKTSFGPKSRLNKVLFSDTRPIFVILDPRFDNEVVIIKVN